MIDYARAKATAARLLNTVANLGNAQTIILTRDISSPGNYDTNTGSIMGAITASQTGSGVVFEYNTFIRSGTRSEAGSLIQSGDKQLLLSPLDSTGADLVPPTEGTRARLADGTSYTITAVAAQSPAGPVIYYECNIRGAP